MVVVKLRRALDPEVLAETECALCGVPFEVGSVYVAAQGVSDEWSDTGTISPTCLGYLSRRNPSSFPSPNEYRENLERYPEPVYASVEEAMQLERADLVAFWRAYEASWLEAERK